MPNTLPEGSRANLGARQTQILERVEQNGFVSVDELAQSFAVTPQTVRRDITDLCERGLLRRYHGGAGFPSSVENMAYAARCALNFKEKREIAALVAEHIPDQASLFITLGTTVEKAAQALRNHRGLRIITNNINVAAALRENPTFEVMLAGGRVRARDAGVAGEATIDFFRQFRVDYALLGISGIELDGALFEFDYTEVRVLRAVMANARKVWLLADHSKIGRNALVRLGHISEIQALFTDSAPPKQLSAVLADSATQVYTPAGVE